MTDVRTRVARRGGRADLVVEGVVMLVVAPAAVVGRRLLADGVDIFLGWPPLPAEWLPHVGPGTPVAVVVAVAAVAWPVSATAGLEHAADRIRAAALLDTPRPADLPDALNRAGAKYVLLITAWSEGLQGRSSGGCPSPPCPMGPSPTLKSPSYGQLGGAGGKHTSRPRLRTASTRPDTCLTIRSSLSLHGGSTR